MKISIIIPSFNTGKYIERTILSIINQDYQNYEIILVDGGSTDDTLAICEKYKHYFTVFISEKDRGQSDAINKGIKLVTGDIWAWQNADDVYKPGAFRGIIEACKGLDLNRCGMIYGSVDYINANDAVLYNKKAWLYDADKLRRGRFNPMQPSVFFSKAVIDKVGLVNEGLNFVMDYDYFVRISQQFDIISVADTFGQFRVHTSSKTSSKKFFEAFKKEYRSQIHKYGKNNFVDKLMIKYYDLYHTLGYQIKYNKIFGR
jgi:glycosyltransferase involved in cell wall biosynthesis